jgi:MerR family mercuric resistance operon transcriptional regulator
MQGPSEVARASGIHVETLRYYERLGLLPPPARTRAGHRLYDDETIALLQSIRAGRSLGLSIDEILALQATIKDDRGTQQAILASLGRALERTRSELARLEARRCKLEALLTELRALSPDTELRERVRGAWRRIDGARRSHAGR